MTVVMLGLFAPYPYSLGAILIFLNVPSLLSISLGDSGFYTIALNLPVPLVTMPYLSAQMPR